MPIYEYSCSQCNHRFEKLLLSHDAAVSCPGCSSTELRRLPSTFSSSSSSAAEEFCPPGGCGRCGAASPGQCLL